MKIAHIGTSNSRTKIINLNDLKDEHGHDFKLPPDPKNNLVIDPRPNRCDRFGWTFDIEIQDSASLIVTKTNGRWWADNLYFRVYNRIEEDVPAAFDSSVPYDYWGLNCERVPIDTIVGKVHNTVTTIKTHAFYECKKMTTSDMSNAPIEEIESYAFQRCHSVRSILFSQILKKIGLCAFGWCRALDILVIPPTVTNIERLAFHDCSNMRILKLPDTINLRNVASNIINRCDAILDKVPPNKHPIHWLKHRYDPYPLHKLCYNAHVTVEAIQQCILQYPRAAYLSDEFDMTALHMITIMACTSNLQTQSHNRDQDEGTTRLLGAFGHITTCFDANMSAAFASDDRDKTPLDYLLESCDGLDVHTALVTSLCLHRNASSCLYQMTGVRHHWTTCCAVM